MHRIAIAGGGITGLSALHWVKKRAPEAKARLFEKESRTGGWIDTTQYSGLYIPYMVNIVF
jgi:protoporphyrinogen oxidase